MATWQGRIEEVLSHQNGSVAHTVNQKPHMLHRHSQLFNMHLWKTVGQYLLASMGYIYGKLLVIPLGPFQALNVGTFVPLRFYEAGPEGVAFESRKYAQYFPQQSTRFIRCEIDVYIVRPQPYRLYEVVYRYSRADGSLLREIRCDWFISTKYRHFWHSGWYGWSSPGRWTPGDYEVQVLLDGVEVAKSGFTIVPAPPPPPPPPPKTLTEMLHQTSVRFYGSRTGYFMDGIDQDSVRFLHQTTHTVICKLTVRNLLYREQDRTYHVSMLCYTTEERLLLEDRRDWLIKSSEQESSIWWKMRPPGQWSPGMYRVEFLIDGENFAWGVFTIE
jgi:hypothetical protein